MKHVRCYVTNHQGIDVANLQETRGPYMFVATNSCFDCFKRFSLTELEYAQMDLSFWNSLSIPIHHIYKYL